MLPVVTVPNSSERAPSTTKISSSPTWRWSGSFASGSIRLRTARRFVAGSSQRLFIRTPGWRSCHGRSLIEMISERGDLVTLMSRLQEERSAVGWTESALFAPELQVLVRRRERIARDEPEPRLFHAPAKAVDEGQLVHRHDHRLLVDELLDPVQHRLTLRAIELDRLLAKQTVDVGIAPVTERAARDRVCLEARGGVAEGAADDLDEVLELPLRHALVERGALERPQPRADSRRLQVADHRLGRVGRGHIAGILAGVEAVRVPGLREEPLGAGRIVGVGRRLPVEVEGTGDDAERDPREPRC